MKRRFYIIPGWEDTCRNHSYRKLKKVAQKKGYEVVCHDINWHKTLSSQLFDTHKDDIIFGFSLGAIAAWIVAQNHRCKHLILASMTPHYSFKDKKIKKSLVDLTGKHFVNDIVKNLKPKNKAKKQTVLYGDLEEEAADFLVKNTGHELNEEYLTTINKLI